MRVELQQKLAGLYGRGGDAEAFDALELDKQQSLLIFVRRLNHLQLWSVVRRVENVYGTGGVGMNFMRGLSSPPRYWVGGILRNYLRSIAAR